MYILEFKDACRAWQAGYSFKSKTQLKSYLTDNGFLQYAKRGKFYYYQNYAAPPPLACYTQFRASFIKIPLNTDKKGN